MRRRSYTFVVGSVFFLFGIMADRLYERASSTRSGANVRSEHSATRAGSPAFRMSASAASAASPRFAPIEAPRNPPRILAIDREEQLTALIMDDFPPAQLVSRKPGSDGSLYTQESTDDGGTLYRTYNPQGTLVGENWKQPSGNEITRAYFDAGTLKGLTWKRSDGSATTISFTQSGLYKGRSDSFPDGSTVSTVYDDQGQVLEVWRTERDGKTTRVQ